MLISGVLLNFPNFEVKIKGMAYCFFFYMAIQILICQNVPLREERRDKSTRPNFIIH